MSVSTLLGFDTETTGIDIRRERIISAALVTRTDDGDDVHTWLINPGVPIPPGSTAVHGITDDMVRESGAPPVEALEEIASALSQAMTEGIPVVAFNAAYDFGILDAELKRHSLPTLTERLGRRIEPVIDPLVVDRGVEPRRPGKRKLPDLCAVYSVTADGNLHTADVDVIATLDVLQAIFKRYPQLNDMSSHDFHEWQAKAHREWAESFNKWLASKGRVSYPASLEWLPDQ